MVQVLYQSTNACGWKCFEGVSKLEKSGLKRILYIVDIDRMHLSLGKSPFLGRGMILETFFTKEFLEMAFPS